MVRVTEGSGKDERTRLQAFEGVVIARRRAGVSSTFTVRKVSFRVGVERIFPLYSPNIDKIDVIKRGAGKRARYYYLRKLQGKAARLKEKRIVRVVAPSAGADRASAEEK